MFDAERLLSDLIGGQFTGRQRKRKRYRYRGGGLGGAVGHAALSPQGLTILGGLAVAAYEHLREKKRESAGLPPGMPPPQPAGTPSLLATPPPFPPAPAPPAPGGAAAGLGTGAGAPSDPHERALLLIEAMVHAAKADGRIDESERARILEHLEREGADPEARAHLESLLSGPTDLERIAVRVRDPQLAAEVYAATLMTIDADTPAEQAYLATLAARLGLDPRVTQALEARLEAHDEESQP